MTAASLFGRQEHTETIRRTLIGPADICSQLGIADGSKRQARGITVRCPAHDDSSASCSVTVGPDGTIRVRCFGCELSGDVFNLIAAVRGWDTKNDFPRILEEAAELAGLFEILEELRGRSGERRGPSPAPLRPKPLPPRAPERTYPPLSEVSALWRDTAPVTEIPGVADYLRGRGLDPEEIAQFDLARALPSAAPLPRWASYRGDAAEARPWVEIGHQLLLPVYDAKGGHRSVRAGRVTEGSTPKRLPPSGHLASGLVLADPLGVAMLSGSGLRGDLLVVEGEPDFLTWASLVARQNAPVAVIGVGSGSWTREHARRVPGGTRVVIRTHRDPAGDKYAAEIGFTLASKCLVLRPGADGFDGDENDRLRAGVLPERHDDGAELLPIEWVDPRTFLLGRLFYEHGWLGDELVVWEKDKVGVAKIRAGVFAARCPTEELHEDGEQFDGRSLVSHDGGHGLYRCSHRLCRNLYGHPEDAIFAMQHSAAEKAH